MALPVSYISFTPFPNAPGRPRGRPERAAEFAPPPPDLYRDQVGPDPSYGRWQAYPCVSAAVLANKGTPTAKPITVTKLQMTTYTLASQATQFASGIRTLWYAGSYQVGAATGVPGPQQQYIALPLDTTTGADYLQLFTANNCGDLGQIWTWDASTNLWAGLDPTYPTGPGKLSPGQPDWQSVGRTLLPLPLDNKPTTPLEQRYFFGYIRYYLGQFYNATYPNAYPAIAQTMPCPFPNWLYGTLGVPTTGVPFLWQYKLNSGEWNWTLRRLDVQSLGQPGTVLVKLPAEKWLPWDPYATRIATRAPIVVYTGIPKFDIRRTTSAIWRWSHDQGFSRLDFIFPTNPALKATNLGREQQPLTWSVYSSTISASDALAKNIRPVPVNPWYTDDLLQGNPAYSLLLRYTFTFQRGDVQAGSSTFGVSLPGLNIQLGSVCCPTDRPFILGPKPYAPNGVQPGVTAGFDQYLTCGTAVMTVNAGTPTCVSTMAFPISEPAVLPAGQPHQSLMLVFTSDGVAQNIQELPLPSLEPTDIITISGTATIPMARAEAVQYCVSSSKCPPIPATPTPVRHCSAYAPIVPIPVQPRPSYACILTSGSSRNTCVQKFDGTGAYDTEAECKASSCFLGSYACVPTSFVGLKDCKTCVQKFDGTGTYDTEAECKASSCLSNPYPDCHCARDGVCPDCLPQPLMSPTNYLDYVPTASSYFSTGAAFSGCMALTSPDQLYKGPGHANLCRRGSKSQGYTWDQACIEAQAKAAEHCKLNCASATFNPHVTEGQYCPIASEIPSYTKANAYPYRPTVSQAQECENLCQSGVPIGGVELCKQGCALIPDGSPTQVCKDSPETQNGYYPNLNQCGVTCTDDDDCKVPGSGKNYCSACDPSPCVHCSKAGKCSDTAS